MDSPELIALLGVGLAAGWIASRIVTGGGRSVLGSLVVGVLGAYIGPLLLEAIEVNPPAGLLGSIVTAVVGAGALLVVAEVVGSLKIVVVGAVIALFVLGGISVSVN
ncbi:MAG: GlsB/YeaQ/YmgE family stress response membrane protein [Chloroflexi bacterium]|nr:GlsB/YeaQ/YmgE family stress response membrane protein [Chloroflexota bacterium]MDA1146263.1 GlsB/YeaQ/YmgE family stress response membrane protein [Chloroflexota bacterium]